MATVVPLHWTRWLSELKIEDLQKTSRPWPMARFQNICTEVFLQWPSTKITKMISLGWTKWLPELKLENLYKTSARELVSRFQSYFTEVFLLWPFTKIAKIVQLSWTKWLPELKIEKTLKQHLLLGQWLDFKMISQKCSSYPPSPNCQNGSALLNKMVTRAKNRKTFKRHLRGQWPDFKIISHQCSS